MEEYFLVIKFKNAKHFPDKKTKDFCINVKNNNTGILPQSKRIEQESFIEPITVYQISNMIHVLLGERPVPTYRPVFYDKVDKYFKKAQNSYLKIDNYMAHNEKTNSDYYVPEIMQTKKSVWNSWQKFTYVNWKKIEKLLGEDFKKFLDILENDFNIINPTFYPCDKIKELVMDKSNESNIKNLFNFFSSIKKSAMISYFKGKYPEDYCSINMNPNTTLTVLNGIERFISLNGTILIPVDKNDIERLKKCFVSPKLLDGGFVYIESITHKNELSSNNFRKVSDISLKTN